ncbi:MAG: N-acetylglucosamine kinase [Alphaproteobacteria bacterium]
MYYLGIDGGGTKTAFTLIDENKEIIFQSRKSGAFYLQTGLEAIKILITEGINEAIEQTHIEPIDIAYVFIGLPGYGEVAADQSKIEAMVASAMGDMKYHLGNDVEAGWAGSLACKAGIHLVAGTGAIAFGMDDNGNQARTSGWNHIFGDEGSAYWVAIQGLQAYSKQKDGRMKKTSLIDIFDQELELDEPFEMIGLIHDTYNADRDKIAALAKFVSKAAKQGDAVALNIFKQAAYEYYLMVQAISNQLQFNGVIPISYSGGVFNAKEYILPHLKQYLAEHHINAQLCTPKFDPEYGAALYAHRLAK